MDYLALATPETAICVITFMSYTVLKVGRAKPEVATSGPLPANSRPR